MPFLFTYLLKLSVSLAVVFLFYQFVLRKLTFYNWNRWYLLGYTLLCFFIPLIDISPVLQRNEWNSSTAVTWIPVIGEYKANAINAIPAFHFFTAWNIISLVVVAGMFAMFLRLLFQLISFRRMMKKAKAIPGEGMNLFQVDEEIIPFSFGNSIFINQHQHTNEELQEIIRHEFVHVKQKHSIDMIWSELLCLCNWYNPFAWMLKRSIRQNLEFIADSKVLENGINKKQYQYLLLKVIGNNQFSIAPKFNFSSLKKRIAMMNKLRTARLHLARSLFMLPVLAVILVSFRQKKQDTIQSVGKSGNGFFVRDTIPDEPNEKGYIIDVIGRKNNATVVAKDRNGKVVERVTYTKWKQNEKSYEDKYGELPPPPPPPLPPTPPEPIELPENVKKIDVSEKKATVVLKDGKVEKYNLDKPDEKAAFKKKYGELAVPPEPPTPPTPPVKPADEDNPGLKVFLKKNSDVKDIGWVYNNVWENVVVEAQIFKKDGTTEKYDLTDKEDLAKAEKKYGKLPYLPPPKNGYMIMGKEVILVAITKNTTPNQLEEFKKQMKEKGIELEFDETEYENGILVNISGTMKSKDVHGNFVATDFNKVTLSMVRNGDHTYFKVRVNDNKKIVM